MSSHPGRPQRRRRLAAAIRWVAGQTGAPVVLASGEGPLAERIVAAAAEAGVPVSQDADLAEVVARLDPGSRVPAEVFITLAAVLAPLLVVRPSLTRSNTQ